MTLDELIALARQTLDREPKNWTDPACLTCAVQAMRMASAVIDLLAEAQPCAVSVDGLMATARVTCRHEYPGVKVDFDFVSQDDIEWLECLDCGEWLSLGPATPPPDYEFSLAIAIGNIPASDHAEGWRDEVVEIWARQFEVSP